MARLHTIVDCSTGQVRHAQMTTEEEAAHVASQAAAQAQLAEEARHDAELAALVRDHRDPVVRYLAKRLGISRED